MTVLTSNRRRLSTPIILLIGVLFVVGSFSSGYALGDAHGLGAASSTSGAVTGQGQVSADLSKDVDFSQFWSIWNLLKDEYVTQPIADKKLFYGSLKGMVASLGDPYTIYFDPDDAKAFNDELGGNFDGIGAEIGVKNNELQVIAPLPSSPAEKAGLKAGDAIIAIDGADTTGMAVDDAVNRIRGTKGTTVTLTILHTGDKAPQIIPITRDTITVDSVKLTMRDDGIAVINVYFFNEDTSGLFQKAVQKVLTSNVKGIVLDLRNDPGGYLTAAIDVASAWVGQNTVVYEQAKDQKQGMDGTGPAVFAGIPTVALIDGGSASASEIVSGALQDSKTATIVGEKSFGKGSVQDFRDLPDGSAIKVTVAKWLTPSGRSIDHDGITPDVTVDFTVDQAKAGQDPQMDKAISIIKATPSK